MAVTIGKRKRDVVQQKPRKATQIEVSDNSDSDDNERMKAIFQKHFEAQFKPLPEKKVKKAEVELEEEEDEGDDAEEDDWEGLSSGEEDAPVQVIEYSDARTDGDKNAASLSKRELKAFLSSKVPKASSVPAIVIKKPDKPGDEEDDSTEKLNLKNDLALQRLLNESHLLDSSTPQSDLEVSGKNRLRALDLRMQSLGVKTSTFDGGKMPMNMRKGVTVHRQGLENKRRRDARENGIILEKEKRVKIVYSEHQARVPARQFSRTSHAHSLRLRCAANVPLINITNSVCPNGFSGL